MDVRGGKTFRLSVEDVRDLMGYLEENNGPNRFSKAIEKKLVEEFVEKDWEIKNSPVSGFETNLEYLFSLIPELYNLSKELSENAEEFARKRRGIRLILSAPIALLSKKEFPPAQESLALENCARR